MGAAALLVGLEEALLREDGGGGGEGGGEEGPEVGGEGEAEVAEPGHLAVSYGHEAAEEGELGAVVEVLSLILAGGGGGGASGGFEHVVE